MQRYIAMETLQVFAPLARLLGMYRIKVFSLPTSLTLLLVPYAVVAYLLLIVLPSKFCCGVFSATS
jgi:hypothetical protein